ncbi:MAG: hypothetical protein FWG73_00775 [Planctomycetaceae bacterium]|nr:hypothetical protein [Planctomycetaceae bacterium]
MLKIGTSKKGSAVDCPKCKKSLVVPPQSSPQAEQLYQMLKNRRLEETAAPPAEDAAQSEPNAPESALDELCTNFDEAYLNQWITELWSKSLEPFPPLPPDLPQTAPPDAVPEPILGEIALIALKKRYKLVVTLLYVSATLAFFIGIGFGIFIRGLYVPSAHPVHWAESGSGVNEVSGTLHYVNENGERRADVDAVIIALPMERPLGLLLSSEGLRPDDLVNNDTVQLIQELGGMYARADATGSFSLPYREGERYHVIRISAYRMPSGGAFSPSEQQVLRRYFHDSELFEGYTIRIEEFQGEGGRYRI